MKFFRLILLVIGTVFICLSSPALSQDFNWVSGFNEQANQDIEAFKTLLAERFSQRLTQVDTIFQEVKTPSDTYMAFKLSEMSRRPISDVVDTYGNGKSKGWGVLAKNLGIKPGSKEFHELKKREDLYHGRYSDSYDKKKKKNKGKGKKKSKKNKDK